MNARKRLALLLATAALGSGVALTPAAATAADSGSVSVRGVYGCNHTNAEPVIRKGARGKAVKQAQCLLKYWNVNIGPHGVDGDFGPDTDRAVREFQSRIKNTCRMPVDGIVGPKTWHALKNPGC
jgi:peptidoglycan hydrolase-like protein with peptidoglycan-binding domain